MTATEILILLGLAFCGGFTFTTVGLQLLVRATSANSLPRTVGRRIGSAFARGIEKRD